MRIRAVRPDFWSDDKLGHVPDAVRLFYIGLWCIADDAGWFEFHVSQLGATLYPYRAVKARERSISSWTATLVNLERVQLFPCGCGFIPTMARHQLIGGKASYALRDKHQRHIAPIGTDGSVPVRTDTSVGKVKVGKEKGGLGGIDWTDRVMALKDR
jgi:hypothetical protein